MKQVIIFRNAWIFFFYFIFSQLLNSYGFAKTSAKTKELKYPSDENVLITVERNIISVFREAKEVFLLAHKRNSFITVPFIDEGKTSEDKFGKFIDSKRTEINKHLQEVAWRGATKYEDKILILDGLAPSFVVLAATKQPGVYEEVLHHNIPRDLLTGPRDSIGEPSKVET